MSPAGTAGTTRDSVISVVDRMAACSLGARRESIAMDSRSIDSLALPGDRALGIPAKVDKEVNGADYSAQRRDQPHRTILKEEKTN